MKKNSKGIYKGVEDYSDQASRKGVSEWEVYKQETWRIKLVK